MKIEIMDLGFMETEEIIASFLLTGEGPSAIVETGPTTCIENLLQGLKDHGVAPEDVEIEVADGVVVAYDTPGHAYHHMAFYEPESGALFTGDVAGVRLPGQSYV